MDKEALERLSMLTILHATCQTALERLAGGRTTDSEIAADLKSILERTRIELDSASPRAERH
jgi:hypothetical protein